MSLRRMAVLVALLALALSFSVVPARAKVLDGCAVLAQEELEAIFEQPFARGEVLTGDYCSFRRPASAAVPDISVQVLVIRVKDVAKAKRLFARDAATTQELAGSVTDLKAVGDEAYSVFFSGTDHVNVRIGRVVGRFRVDQIGSDNVFPDQVVAVAQAAAPRLENYSKAG